MKIIVDEKETELVGDLDGSSPNKAIVHGNDIVRHANRLRSLGAKSILFELTAKEAEAVGELPKSKDFRVAVEGPKGPKAA